MSTAGNIVEPRLSSVQVTDDEIIARLVDGRTISVPLVWSWRLTEATLEQRRKFEILGVVRVFIGLMSTRILASKECCMARRLLARTNPRNRQPNHCWTIGNTPTPG